MQTRWMTEWLILFCVLQGPFRLPKWKVQSANAQIPKDNNPLGEIPAACIYVLLTYHLLVVFVRPSRDGVGLALRQQSLLDPLQIGGESHPGLHFAKNNREKWSVRWKRAAPPMTPWQTAFCCLLKTRLQKLFSGIKSCHTSAAADEITAKACVVSWYMTHKSGMYQAAETRCPFPATLWIDYLSLRTRWASNSRSLKYFLEKQW